MAFLAYLWGKGDAPLRAKLPSGQYDVSWIDTAAGKRIDNPVRISAHDAVTLSPPPCKHDLVCHIEKVASRKSAGACLSRASNANHRGCRWRFTNSDV